MTVATTNLTDAFLFTGDNFIKNPSSVTNMTNQTENNRLKVTSKSDLQKGNYRELQKGFKTRLLFLKFTVF